MYVYIVIIIIIIVISQKIISQKPKVIFQGNEGKI